MNKFAKKAAIGLILQCAVAASAQQTVLQQLKSQAGEDAVAAAAPQPTVLAVQPPQISAATAAKVRATFMSLVQRDFPGVRWHGMPLGVRYARLPLREVACRGCVSYTALLPVGALTPTAPIGDPNKAPYFVIERSGSSIKPEARYSEPVALPVKDVLAACSDVDAVNIRAWSLPEAVSHTQACLDKTYNQNPLTRKLYFVTAQTGKVMINRCPPFAECIMGPIAVDGITITVSGRVPAEDTVVSDIVYSLNRREGKLYGFPASFANPTDIVQ